MEFFLMDFLIFYMFYFFIFYMASKKSCNNKKLF